MTRSPSAKVTDSSGHQGQILSSQANEHSLVLILLDTGERIWLPQAILAPCENGDYLIPFDLTPSPGTPPILGSPDTLRIPVIEETLHVDKHPVQTGGVRVTKHVRLQHKSVDIPLSRERVEIKTVPVNRVVAEAGSSRHEGDTLIIPVYEEVLMVQKQILLKEEIHVITHHMTEQQSQSVQVKSEEVIVEPLHP